MLRGYCRACDRDVDATEDRDFTNGTTYYSCTSCSAPTAPISGDVVDCSPETAPESLLDQYKNRSKQPSKEAHSVVNIARERLEQVRLELRSVAKLQAEEKMLAAMIEAAEKINGS